MSTAAQSLPAPPPESDEDAEEARHYRATLRKLIDKATDLAEEVHAEAKTRPPAATAPKRALTIADYARAYESLARGIRRGILLARELTKPLPARRTPAEYRVHARQEILRAVEDKIHRHAPDHEAHDLQRELHERLDTPDLAREIRIRPLADLITEIARDLGLEASPISDPWKRRKPRDLAQLHTRAAAQPHAAPILTFAPTPAPARSPQTNHPQANERRWSRPP